MMARPMIIGGAGFIGSHLVDVCLLRNLQICIYDNFSTGRKEFLQEDSAIRVIEGDVLDTKHLSEVIGHFAPDTIFHLAAIHHIPTCEREPERALRTNVEGTQSLLTACAQRNIPRIVFASTGALYDPGHVGALAETSSVNARDIYGISKLAGEQLLEHHIRTHGGCAIVARLFNTVGRRETNSHVIPAIMAQLKAGARTVQLGNLDPRRDYVHVEDVAEALAILGSLSLEDPYGIFNVGSGKEYSIHDLLRMCSEVISDPLEIESVPQLQRRADRPSQLADLTKIQRVCGWAPTRTVKQALAEIWAENEEPRRIS